MGISNPCQRCGACCAYYRASFYWTEADDAPGGHVPVKMTLQISPLLRAMRGTELPQARCCALDGEVGQSVSCGIYPLRASSCREFEASWVNGLHNPRCDVARAHWGLPPLQPEDLRDDPRAA